MITIKNTTTGSSTVAKCLKALEVIAAQVADGNADGLTLKEIAELTGFSMATTYRYLQSLEEFRLLRRDSDGCYSLGSRVVELYHLYLNSHDLRSLAWKYMKDLAEKTQETIYLGVLEGLEVFYLERIDSPLPIRPHTTIGGRNELHCTGLGKAILAFSDDSLVEEVIEAGLVKRTEQTITERGRLIAELQKIREAGFSCDNMENEEHVKCVAAPIYNGRGRVIAAISISGPSFRMDDERMELCLGPLVVEAGASISKELGYLGPYGQQSIEL